MPKVTVSHSCEPMATSIKQEPKSGCGSAKKCGCGCKGAKSKPNFATMTSEERLLFHRTRIAKLFGE